MAAGGMRRRVTQCRQLLGSASRCHLRLFLQSDRLRFNRHRGPLITERCATGCFAAGLLPFAIGSETWGSIVCPASTVGVSAYRPSGGTIPNNGMLQVGCQHCMYSVHVRLTHACLCHMML